MYVADLKTPAGSNTYFSHKVTEYNNLTQKTTMATTTMTTTMMVMALTMMTMMTGDDEPFHILHQLPGTVYHRCHNSCLTPHLSTTSQNIVAASILRLNISYTGILIYTYFSLYPLRRLCIHKILCVCVYLENI